MKKISEIESVVSVHKYMYKGKRSNPIITDKWYANLQEVYVALMNECYDVGVKPVRIEWTERLDRTKKIN